MSTSFSANQYESAFKSKNLQNWTIPKQFKERPSAAEGHTTFIATDCGHLLPGVRAKRGSAWPTFQGTWDLPRRIPPVYINPTARSQEGQDRLRTWGQMKSTLIQAHETTGGSRASNRTSRAVENTNVDQPAEAPNMPVSTQDQKEPVLDTERPTSQHSQAQSRPASQSDQKAQPTTVNFHENQAQSRPASQHSHQAQSRPATQHSLAELRPPTQNSRPASHQALVPANK